MGKNLCCVLYITMSYNQHELYTKNQKMMDCEFVIHFNLISHHNTGISIQRTPSIWVCSFTIRRPSKRVHFQKPNTHIWAFFYWSRPHPQVRQDNCQEKLLIYDTFDKRFHDDIVLKSSWPSLIPGSRIMIRHVNGILLMEWSTTSQ